MGWLQRIFGQESNQAESTQVDSGIAAGVSSAGDAVSSSGGGGIPPERVGLNGEYDQSGLAKRVAQAFDQDPNLAQVETVWVAQLTGTVVLKGTVPDQATLDQLVAIASGISGATSVDTAQVKVG